MPVLPSYRNQSTDLHSKSIDWFLYESNTEFAVMDASAVSHLFSKPSREILSLNFLFSVKTFVLHDCCHGRIIGKHLQNHCDWILNSGKPSRCSEVQLNRKKHHIICLITVFTPMRILKNLSPNIGRVMGDYALQI